MSSGYTKLANSILTSTIWMEDDHTRIVWLAILAMADKNGEVMASTPGLANVARVPVEGCRKAIEIFLSPDPDSRSKDDEGRRLQEIPGGWFVLNHDHYRKLASDEDRKEKAAARQRRARERKKLKEQEDEASRQASEASQNPPRSKGKATAAPKKQPALKGSDQAVYIDSTISGCFESKASPIVTPESHQKTHTDTKADTKAKAEVHAAADAGTSDHLLNRLADNQTAAAAAAQNRADEKAREAQRKACDHHPVTAAQPDHEKNISAILRAFGCSPDVAMLGAALNEFMAKPEFLTDEASAQICQNANAWGSQDWIKDTSPSFIAKRLDDIYHYKPLNKKKTSKVTISNKPY